MYEAASVAKDYEEVVQELLTGSISTDKCRSRSWLLSHLVGLLCVLITTLKSYGKSSTYPYHKPEENHPPGKDSTQNNFKLDRKSSKICWISKTKEAIKLYSYNQKKNHTQLWWVPNVVAHQKEGIEAVHLASGRTLCRLHLQEGGHHADINGDGVLDHVQAVGRNGAELSVITGSMEVLRPCWAFSYFSDGTNDKIQAVIDSGFCGRLVELLYHPSPSVLIPALRTVGNIVTGDDMRAKVADFGLVRLAPDGKASLVTRLAGTFGYLAPEYAVTGRAY